MSVLLWNRCPAIFAAMGAQPEVVGPAVAYMRARCIASPAILMYYVLSGTFRGFKDTKCAGGGRPRGSAWCVPGLMWVDVGVWA